MSEEAGVFVGHFPCPECESKDNLAVYEKEDEKGDSYKNGYCFGCESYFTSKKLTQHFGDDFGYVPVSHNARKGEEKTLSNSDKEEILELPFKGWKERRLPTWVSEMYGVRSELSQEDGNTVVARYYPNYASGEIVGFKKRTLPKEFMGIGNTKATNQLFGQNVFEKGQKYLVITTGEEDALAMAKVLAKKDGDREFFTPCVSVTCGDGSIVKQLKANYEYINSFEKVVLMFDQDESGQKHVEEAARLLSPGKAFIAKMSRKDASQMVKEGLESQLRNAFFKAERFSPIGVTSLGSLWDEFANATEDEILELPPEFAELMDQMGGGPAMGEVTTWGALTSIGKSTIIRRLMYWWGVKAKRTRKIGILELESSGKDIVQGLLSVHKQENLALKRKSELDMASLHQDFKNMIGNDDGFVVVDHQGAFTSIDEMFEKIRWLIKGAGCEIVFIDPLQAAVPSNENSSIDEFMDALLKLAKETGAAIQLVSHMRKPEGENPHAVSEYHLKGSSSINQISFNTILMSRDKVNENALIKNSTKLTLVKCRRTGMTGDSGWLFYDAKTSTLTQSVDPYEDSNGEVGMDDDQSEFLNRPDSYHPSSDGEVSNMMGHEAPQEPVETVQEKLDEGGSQEAPPWDDVVETQVDDEDDDETY